MKFFSPLIFVFFLLATPALADDNVANCEIVVQQAIEADVKHEDASDKAGAQIATFVPAADFIFSVFDAEDGHMAAIDGKPIRAVMCIRSSVIPTEFDFKIIRTGIPFYLSPNFDTNDSALMAINITKNGYAYNYVGPDLSKDNTELLKLRMKLLNEEEENNDED